MPAKLPISNSAFARADVVVFGVPDDSGTAYRRGAALAPDAIRRFASKNEVGLVKRKGGVSIFMPEPRKIDARIHDYGDLKKSSLRGEISQMHKAGKFPIMIGGDHSVTYTALQGISPSKKFSLIYLDAHPDYICSSSDYFGSVVCDISRLRNADMKSSVIIGARAMEDEEIDGIEASGIKVISGTDIVEIGPKKVAETVEHTVSANAYMPIDMDVVDPAFAPGVTTPISGGISAAELLYFARRFSRKTTLGCDIMEVCPNYDIENRTLDLAYRLILEIISSRR